MRDHGEYEVVFHYNTYNFTWYCIPRDSYTSYFNMSFEEKNKKFGTGDDTVQAYKSYLKKKHAVKEV